MKRSLLLLPLLMVAAPATIAAQSVEMLFTPGVVQQALAIKGTLKVDTLEAFGALALLGASAERTKAYVDKTAHVTAVVIIGEDALKAAAQVEFSVPIITVNAAGATAAKNRVLRVFDSGSAPAAAKAITPDAVAGLIGSAKEVLLKGEIGPIVQALIVALK